MAGLLVANWYPYGAGGIFGLLGGFTYELLIDSSLVRMKDCYIRGDFIYSNTFLHIYGSRGWLSTFCIEYVVWLNCSIACFFGISYFLRV